MIVHPRNYSVSQTHIVEVPVILLLQVKVEIHHSRCTVRTCKQLAHSIPGSRHGSNVGCIARCSMFIELADYETVG